MSRLPLPPALATPSTQVSQLPRAPVPDIAALASSTLAQCSTQSPPHAHTDAHMHTETETQRHTSTWSYWHTSEQAH
eukprot:4771534-Alexandrium_andersonii.AAC.1